MEAHMNKPECFLESKTKARVQSSSSTCLDPLCWESRESSSGAFLCPFPYLKEGGKMITYGFSWSSVQLTSVHVSQSQVQERMTSTVISYPGVHYTLTYGISHCETLKKNSLLILNLNHCFLKALLMPSIFFWVQLVAGMWKGMGENTEMKWSHFFHRSTQGSVSLLLNSIFNFFFSAWCTSGNLFSSHLSVRHITYLGATRRLQSYEGFFFIICFEFFFFFGGINAISNT